MSARAPGSYVPCVERVGRFEALFAQHDGPLFVIADERVLRLHPHVSRALGRSPLVSLRAGEGAKTLRVVERLALAAAGVPRQATVLAIGGGTIGDVATVFAHLHKRGARLVHVPTTWLAAVDSSVGGKGAVNVGGVKNALGVFHAPAEGWLCDELFTTLTPAQRVEGEAEAFKMALTLDARAWRTWRLASPDDRALVSTARVLKARVCAADPYEQRGLRAVLNFGHTLGHVIESVTRYRVRHGVAVALGMRCALDLGVQVGVTPAPLAQEVDRRLPLASTARAALARALAGVSAAQVEGLLRSDKKGGGAGHTNFVLLEKVGQANVHAVPHAAWKRLLRRWGRGA
jgi:3-dehydroquinate synthase